MGEKALWGGPTRRYEVESTFRAPLPYVFRWCTDYRSGDGRTSGEGYDRRILSRSDDRIVFEDLYDTPGGWIWIRRSVKLLPPNRWHADSVGSDRVLSVDYRLEGLPGGRTRLSITARRRPYGIGVANPSKSEWESRVTENWHRLGRILERDFRKRRSIARGRQ